MAPQARYWSQVPSSLVKMWLSILQLGPVITRFSGRWNSKRIVSTVA
jgi:hypothetical protein